MPMGKSAVAKTQIVGPGADNLPPARVTTEPRGKPNVSAKLKGNKAQKLMAKRKQAQNEAPEAPVAVEPAPEAPQEVETPPEAPKEAPQEPKEPVEAPKEPKEAPKEAAEAEKGAEEPPPYARQFAALKKQGKRLREAADQLTKEKEQFQKEVEAAKQHYSDADELKQLAASSKPDDAFKLIQKLGIDPEEWVNWAEGKGRASGAQPEVEAPASGLSKEDREFIEWARREKEQSAQRQQEQEVEAGKQKNKEEISEFLGARKADYEFLSARPDPAEDVYSVILQSYINQLNAGATDPKILTIQEACVELEQHLENHAKSFLGVGKFKKLLGQTETSQSDDAAPNKSQQRSTGTDRLPPDQALSGRQRRDALREKAVAILKRGSRQT